MKNISREINIYKKIIKSCLRNKLGCPSPFYTLYYCTWRCNLSCLFCPINSSSFKDKECLFLQKYAPARIENEMTTRQAKYAIDQLDKLGIYFILFGGGEPLLREDLEELAFYAKEKNIITALSTNGTLITENRAKSLMDCFDIIMISIHGLEDIDDKIKQKEGSFKKSLDGLRLLKRHTGAGVGINFVINKYNYHQIDDILNLAKENCDFIGYISVNWDFGSDFSLGKEISKETVNQLLKLKQKNKKFITNSKTYLNLFANHLSGEKTLRKCDAFKLFTQVGPAGEFGGCERSFVVGNILDQDITDLVKSGRARRKEIQSDCQEIVCRAHLPHLSHLSMLKISNKDIVKKILKKMLFKY